MNLDEIRNLRLKELHSKTNAEIWKRICDMKERESELNFGDCVEIRTNLNESEREDILDMALNLRSWRKGPFKIDDIFIDSEWRSFVKFNILKPHMNLEGKIVGDIGCNNGYYLFKMLPFKPKKLIGFDPSINTFMQFKFINRFVRSSIYYELLGVEHLPYCEHKFDTLFCLGVLYHRSDPVKMLKELKGSLNKGGEVFLDTMYIDMRGEFALSPKKTYSKIPNIYFVPTIDALTGWCERAKFKDIEILATKDTDFSEQRKTDWILGQSLENFLDENDPNLTIEGYPAPKRVYLKLGI
ncbi:tRNA 5-methoxyuridine(34)/uridine 5-oxyacetic acid(34) synthase CmoB [Campylobacter sp. CCUG 57310]|uniref:tRNA 5-methoxyuridine(34)/uridine 5-oxyacetic acid(34) synthase CmoB n=1 Tax=Campylobacter sp. CCUG 57310 TaxID=2517362 RepID=UPI001564F085|nr:tRNA 5-methoxyuridine(34)/uridine 5-oxyacetic acid(34) synthase CmoB [Campylobacter sp. CCUG 57310]QKF92410.1 tRNA (cmo5U34)-carboxymethyltransferase [Campylobacter sp. CCUG 57310]